MGIGYQRGLAIFKNGTERIGCTEIDTNNDIHGDQGESAWLDLASISKGLLRPEFTISTVSQNGNRFNKPLAAKESWQKKPARLTITGSTYHANSESKLKTNIDVSDRSRFGA